MTGLSQFCFYSKGISIASRVKLFQGLSGMPEVFTKVSTQGKATKVFREHFLAHNFWLACSLLQLVLPVLLEFFSQSVQSQCWPWTWTEFPDFWRSLSALLSLWNRPPHTHLPWQPLILSTFSLCQWDSCSLLEMHHSVPSWENVLRKKIG